jgi:Tol biopolymer transport system component
MRRIIAAFVLVGGLWVAAPAQAAGQLRLLFNSDWSGTEEVYAADPTGANPAAQVTPGPATCVPGDCHYGDMDFGAAVPSPNGRFILYTEWQSTCSESQLATLFVARADGTHARVLARSRSHICLPAPLGFSASWAPDSKRIAYVGYDRLHNIYRIHTVDLGGHHNRVIGDGDRVSWSSDGTSIAFSNAGSVWVRRHGRTRAVAQGFGFWWSPNGRWLTYCTDESSLYGGYCGAAGIVRPDGSKERTVLVGAADPPEWSGDSRFLSVWTPDGVTIVDVASGATHVLSFSADVDDGAIAWQHDGHVLAVTGKDGTRIVDAATGTARLLTPDRADAGAAWSPDGSYLAYATSTQVGGSYYAITDLHVATLAGETRTLVSGAGAYGGGEWNLVWTRAPSRGNYRLPQPRVLAAVGADGLTAPWPITGLAADGDRVGYISCDHVFVWTPSAQTVVQAEPSSSLSPLCLSPSFSANFSFYTLALSGDRIAYGWVEGSTGRSCGLEGERIDDPASFFANDTFGGFCGYDKCDNGFGDLTGGGGLLVSSAWQRAVACPGPPSEQEIRRLDYDRGWSSTVIATAPGPLVPFDVDAGRIVAGGENATVLYDASGTQLLSVPVSPLAAQLSGSDLVILVRGQLLVYDAVSGARLHAWPLPDAASGWECGSIDRGAWQCGGTQLVLEDAAHGLAAYFLDGQVHVIRLRNGTDTTIGQGTLARFVNAGLVYADGTDLHLVPFEKLPFD